MIVFGALALVFAAFPRILPLNVSTTNERVAFAEAGLLLLAISAAGIMPKDSSWGTASQAVRRSITISQISVLLATFLSLFASTGYIRPIAFFVLLMIYFSTLFLDVLYPVSTGAFLIKLFLGQALWMGSSAILYPGFIGVDSYRDYYIAQSIVTNAGGLPKPFALYVWYNVTPTAPVLYAVGNILPHLSLRVSELLVGFVVASVTVLVSGSLARRITKDIRGVFLTMWMGCLIPYVWVWATWPIPEMLAVVLAICSIAVVLLKYQRSSTFILISLFMAVLALTYGGTILELVLILLTIYLFTRRTTALQGGLLAFAFFLIYNIFVVSEGTQFGFFTLFQYLQTLFTFGSFTSAPTVPAQNWLISLVESVSSTYWFVFLVGVSFFYAISLLNKRLRKDGSLVVLFVLSFVLVVSGFVFSFLLPSSLAGGQAVRYISLLAFPLLVPFVSAVILSVLRSRLGRRLVIPLIIALFIFSAVSNGNVSTDLWRAVGQPGYATSYMLPFTTTYQEMQSQLYLHAYDSTFMVVANYFPEFANLSLTTLPSSLTFGVPFYAVGLVPQDAQPIPPYLILNSSVALSLRQNIVYYSHYSSTKAGVLDFLYSNPTSSIILVGK